MAVKVGDMFIVRSDLEKDKRYIYPDNRSERTNHLTARDHHIRHKGKLVRVTQLHESQPAAFQLDVDYGDHYWIEAFLQPYVTTRDELVAMLVEGKIKDDQYKELLHNMK